MMLLSFLLAAILGAGVAPQQASAPAPAGSQASSVTPAELSGAIDKLGSFDFPARSAASRTVRRADAKIAVPALVKAVHEHADSYVRYRALILLGGFGDAATADTMASVFDDKNDRLRMAAYQWYARHPDPAMLPRLIAALPKEQSEFVRPSLIQAVVAQGSDPSAQQVILPLITSGPDYFRGEVIEALGNAKAAYARDAILEVAKLDGPLQEDAVLALGRIGDRSVLSALAALQQSAPRERQPALAAATCLLGLSGDAPETYLLTTLTFAATTSGYQPLLRATAHALAAVAASGDRRALNALIDVGVPAQDPARSPIALAVGTAALHDPVFLLDVLAERHDVDAVCSLLRDAFDMLEEDYAEEQFYVAIRRAYWSAPANSARRAAAERLIQVLEF